MIPKSNDILFPLLELLEDRKDHTLDECIIKLRKKFDVSDDEVKLKFQKKKTSPQKTIPRNKYQHNVTDAVHILKDRKLIQHSKLAEFHITEQGVKHLNNLRKKN